MNEDHLYISKQRVELARRRLRGMARSLQSLEVATSPGDSHVHSWRLSIIIASLCLGVFLYGLDVSIVGTAIPRITTEFHSLSSVSWYGSAYLLSVTAFQPSFGSLYKLFNIKTVYLLSITTFEVGSIICASAPTSGVLIFGRAILGFGAAGLLQGGLAFIGYLVELDKVPMFQGILVSALFVSSSVGPIIGGALTQRATWRWCFWINVPIGFITIIVVLILIPASHFANQSTTEMRLRQKVQRMDVVGTVLFIGAVCCLLLALTWGGQTYSWADSKVIGLFVGFGVITPLFLYWMHIRADLALIPLRIIRKRTICMSTIVLFTLGMSSIVYGYYLPIFFQSSQGVSTTESGVRFIAFAIPLVAGLVVTGGVVSIWGQYVPFMIAGVIIASIGAGFLTTINVSTPTATWAAVMVVTGIGLGMVQQLPYTAVQAVLDPVDVSTGNALAVLTFQLGGAVGLAIGQNLLLNKLQTAVFQYTDAVTPDEVIAAGATGLTALTSSPAVLDALRHAYSDSIRYTTLLALAGVCLAFPACCGMERFNIKEIAAARQREKEQSKVSAVQAQPI